MQWYFIFQVAGEGRHFSCKELIFTLSFIMAGRKSYAMLFILSIKIISCKEFTLTFSYGGQTCKLHYMIREYHVYVAYISLVVYVGCGIYWRVAFIHGRRLIEKIR